VTNARRTDSINQDSSSVALDSSMGGWRVALMIIFVLVGTCCGANLDVWVIAVDDFEKSEEASSSIYLVARVKSLQDAPDAAIQKGQIGRLIFSQKSDADSSNSQFSMLPVEAIRPGSVATVSIHPIEKMPSQWKGLDDFEQMIVYMTQSTLHRESNMPASAP